MLCPVIHSHRVAADWEKRMNPASGSLPFASLRTAESRMERGEERRGEEFAFVMHYACNQMEWLNSIQST